MRHKAIITLVSILCVSIFISSQQNPPPVTLVPVAGPVYMLTGDGGNVGIVADDAGLFMIDAMFEQEAGQIREAIKPLAGGSRVRVLVNTHWHSDHTDGNKALGPGAAIIAHENVRALLVKDQTLMGGQTKALPAGAQPNITFSDELAVYAGGETIRLVHFPHAHTNGDTVVFLDRLKVVHMGEMFFNGMFPFLDVANGGDITSWVRQLDIILAGLPADVKIIPGHGPLAGVADLKAFRDMLNASADLVGKQMKAGKTLDEIKAARLPDSLEVWAKGFLKGPQWLELVYRSLEKPTESLK
jgi:glyoxylase-like metal-dependent hydrolase (beta-lactamase superfamily II)